MKIIRLIKKNRNEVIVQLDNGEQFILDYEIVLKESLRKNDELSSEKIEYLLEENKKYKIRQKALSFFARRLHSSGELRLKLRAKGFQKHLIDAVLGQLTESGVLNDRQFAEAFADEKSRISKWSANRIRKELFKRGIKREIIEDVMKNLERDDIESEHAYQFAIKRYRSLSRNITDIIKLRRKIFNSLMTKGFDYGICKNVVEKILGREEEDT